MIRTLVLDIETFPIIAAVWGLRDQNIGLNQIRKDWSLMAWGAKWLGEPASKVLYADTRAQKDVRDDSKILKTVWQLLNEADIVISQNGQSFDGPKLNAKFMQYKMLPPSPYKHLDTYRVARRVAEFTSNKLEYLTGKLNVKYKKILHAKYSGMVLWNECEKGNLEAWKEMEKYNKHDVLSTEELYTNLQPWIPQSMPNPEHECPRRFAVKWDKRTTSAGVFQIYKCKKCGHKFKGEKVS